MNQDHMILSLAIRIINVKSTTAAFPSWSLCAMAFAINDFALLGLHLRQRDTSVRRGGGGAVQLCCTFTIEFRSNLGCEGLGFINEVPCGRWAHWNITRLLFVVRRRVHGVAPRLVLRSIRIPAVVVVAKAVRR